MSADLPDRDYRSWCRFVNLTARWIVVICNIGAIIGTVWLFGTLSQLGSSRRYHRFLCSAGTADRAAVRLLAHCGDVVCLGSFLMQVFIQVPGV